LSGEGAKETKGNPFVLRNWEIEKILKKFKLTEQADNNKFSFSLIFADIDSHRGNSSITYCNNSPSRVTQCTNTTIRGEFGCKKTAHFTFRK
jgi:hypothetical protein